jgi:fatty acyl-CoA reductase
LVANLNVIINSAGTVEFDTRLDLATSVNVTGAVALMQLADQCA